MQFGNDVLRRPGANEQSHPSVEVESRQRGGNTGYIRQHRGPARSRNGNRPHAFVLHMRQHADDVGELQVDAAAQRVDESRRCALVRHMVHLDLRQRLQVLHAEVLQVADAGRGVVELARIVARQRDQVLYRFHRQRRMYHQHHRPADDLRDRREILLRVVGQILAQGHVDGHRPGIGQHHGVTVGWGFRHHVSADAATGAAAVIDQYLLPPHRGQLLTQGARNVVERATRRVGHDNPHRFRRERLCLHRRHCAQDQSKRGQRLAPTAIAICHDALLRKIAGMRCPRYRFSAIQSATYVAPRKRLSPWQCSAPPSSAVKIFKVFFFELTAS